MGFFEEREAYIKSRGGLVKAKSEAKKAILSSLRDPSDDSVSLWKGVMQSGRIYSFVYEPIGKDELPFYDRRPLVLCMNSFVSESGHVIEQGFNLHFMTPKIKGYFFDSLKRIYGERPFESLAGALKEKPLRDAVFERLKYAVGEQFASIPLRNYRAEMRRNCFSISLSRVMEASILDIADFEGIDRYGVRLLYSDALNGK